MNLDEIRYIPAYYQKGGIQTAKAEIIVMHSMECPAQVGRALNWAKALALPTGSRSFAHYQTDPGGIVRSAPHGRVCPHVGNGNMVRGIWTLGIEQAGYARFTRRQWIDSGAFGTAGPLVAALIADGHGANRWLEAEHLKVPGVRGVTSHNNMRLAFGGTSHTDPGVNYPHDVLLPAPAPVPTPSPQEDDMIASARNADGRLEVFRVTVYKTVQHAWQPAPNKPLGGWVDMPGVEASRGVTAVEDVDGRIELFAYTDDYSVFQCWQTVPNGGWSPWAKL